MECEKEDRLIIQQYEPSGILPLTHEELHQKREEVLKKIEAKRQSDRLDEALSKMPIVTE